MYFLYRLYSGYLYFRASTRKSQADFHGTVERAVSDFVQCSNLKSARYCAYAADGSITNAVVFIMHKQAHQGAIYI